MEKSSTQLTPFLKRVRLALAVSSALLLAAAAALYIIPDAVRSSGFSPDPGLSAAVASSVVNRPANERVASRYKALGYIPELPGVDGAGQVVLISPVTVLNHDGYYGSATPLFVSAGEEVSMTFANWPSGRAGYRLVDSEGEKYGCVVSEADLASLYIARLEQSGQAALFQAQTGLELNQSNAVVALTAIDKYLYDRGVEMPAGYPRYMRVTGSLRTALSALFCLAFIALILFLIIVPRSLRNKAWSDENTSNWRELTAGGAQFRSLTGFGERADKPISQKPDRHELLRQISELDKREAQRQVKRKP